MIDCSLPTVIAATRSDDEFRIALRSVPSTIFDLAPDLMTVSTKLRLAREAGKQLYLHMDLARGIGKDESGLRYLSRLGIDGIISTKSALIKQARGGGLATVQRFFIVDSRSVETTLEALHSSLPNMMEIMPGVSSKIIRKLRTYTDIPIIAGGLIENMKEVNEALSAGAAAVSTGQQSLWSVKSE